MFKFKKPILALALTIFFAGCASSPAPLTQTRYEQVLHDVVCETVTTLNAAGKLKDANALSETLTTTLQKKLSAEQISSEEWARVEKSLAPDRRAKLVKLDFTECVIGLSEGI